MEWDPESQDDEKTVKTAVSTRRVRAMSVELITLADELERGADGDGLR